VFRMLIGDLAQDQCLWMVVLDVNESNLST
jgi:hypothetical protein